MSRVVYIVDGARTPFLKARSGPGPFTPVDLAVQCGRPLLLRQPFAADAFDQVILGCVNVVADEQNPARVAALRLGCGPQMTAFTVAINCGSGMQSIVLAIQTVASAGDEIVYLNYVMTNTSSEPIKLTDLVVDVIPRYADWPYMAGMDGIVDRAVAEQMNVNYFAVGTTGAEAPYAWAPDETFSYSDNFEYQAGSVINFDIGLTPSDDEGELLHDEKQTLTASTTVK